LVKTRASTTSLGMVLRGLLIPVLSSSEAHAMVLWRLSPELQAFWMSSSLV
jgi:hypothetical protein